MRRILLKHKNHWKEKKLVFSSLTGAVFFAFSLIVNQTAARYATMVASSSVQDLFLSNLPVFNVDFIVNNVAIMFLIFILILLAVEPKRIPFAFKSAALFIIIRSAFVVLTHLGPFPVRSYIDQDDLFRTFNIGGDYFFSGHTGLPFLMALIFWDEKWIRYTAIVASLVFGTSVILGHLHYSIDVFAAFFFTYGIFHMTKKFFPLDYKLFSKKEECD
jgi:membrane-associated phospholipid phosphatase